MAQPQISGPNGNTPGAGIGIDTTAIVSTFDVYKPQKRNQLYRIYGDQGLSLFNILDSFGYSEAIQGTFRNTYSEDRIQQLIYIGTGGLVKASQTEYSFLLSTGATTNNYLPTSTTAPYVTAQYYPTVQVSDVIMFPPKSGTTGKDVQGWVSSISGTGNTLTVTVKLLDATNNLTAADFPAGTALIQTSTVFSEGSTQPDGFVPKPLEDTAWLQIIKRSFKYTGTQQIMQSWFEVIPNGGGQGTDLYIIKGQEDTEYRFMADVDGAMMVGQLNTNTSQIDPVTNEPYQTTEGLLPYIRRAGYNRSYTPGSWTVGQFDEIGKILIRELAPRNSMVLAGYDWYIENENVLKDYFQNTNIIYAEDRIASELLAGDKGLAASVDFTYLTKGQYTYCFNRMPNFSNPRSYGATGFDFTKKAAFVPLGKQPDAKTGDPIPYIGMIYGAKGGYSRKAETWTLSGAGPGPKVLQEDLSKLCMRGHIGAEHVGGNRMILVEP